MSARPPLILIVGLQKSGTTLLNRLLLSTERFVPIGPSEANEFWGNTPPFAPEGDPVGLAYQRHQGARGHEMTAEDATPGTGERLRARLPDVPPGKGLLNKNPYNLVRIGWLREVLPEAIIVATRRAPIPNVYSLCKKFVPHPGRGQAPQEGWWGLKPSNWQDLIDPDPVTQAANQWAAARDILERDISLVDFVFDYDEICRDPAGSVRSILEASEIPAPDADWGPDTISNRDAEHATGSSLKSKNRHFRQSGDLSLPEDDTIEFPPFGESEISRIVSIVGPEIRS